MRLFHRTNRPDDDPKLHARLSRIFDDTRTPGAPDSLYSYLREVSMDPFTEPGRGRWSFLGSLGRGARTAAAFTAVLIVVVGAIAVTVVIPRGSGAGAGATATPAVFPPAPSAPAGWRFQMSFGGMSPYGQVGSNLLPPASRIAIHVVCSGPETLVVMVSTEPGFSTPEDKALQAAWFHCDRESEGRVELVAPSGSFQNVLAVVARSPSSFAVTSYVVSIEVPDESPSPSPSR